MVKILRHTVTILRRTITLEEQETFKPEGTKVLFTLECRRIFNESMDMLNIDTHKHYSITTGEPDKLSIDFHYLLHIDNIVLTLYIAPLTFEKGDWRREESALLSSIEKSGYVLRRWDGFQFL